MPWQILEPSFEVSAKPAGIWSLVRDFLPGPLLLKFTVKPPSTWSYSPGVICSADGDYGAILPQNAAIMALAPFGALIAKFGGSSAGTKDGDVLLVGTRCTYAFVHVGAPLYLTINDDPKSMNDNDGIVAVEIAFCVPGFLYSAGASIGMAPGFPVPSAPVAGLAQAPLEFTTPPSPI